MNIETEAPLHSGAATEGANAGDADPCWIIVAQVKSERVVYFTDDPHYQPSVEDWCYVSQYQGRLPEGMTLRNCWGWRFNGGVFSDARPAAPKPQAERLLDSNRQALLRLLHDKIEAVRQPLLPHLASGYELRRRKLDEANQLQAQGSGPLPLLQAVAVARGISLQEAGALIRHKAAQFDEVLLETERFREQLAHAIAAATNQAQLLQIRQWLLEDVYPALSGQFKHRSDHTTPQDPHAPLPATARQHEVSRLKAQLREAINARRKPIDSAYIQNDDLRKHKLKLAQALLAADGQCNPGMDWRLLQAYAEARAWSMAEAAQHLVAGAAAGSQLLAETEMHKDQLLAQIEQVACLRDVHALDEAISTLATASPPAPAHQ